MPSTLPLIAFAVVVVLILVATAAYLVYRSLDEEELSRIDLSSSRGSFLLDELTERIEQIEFSKDEISLDRVRPVARDLVERGGQVSRQALERARESGGEIDWARIGKVALGFAPLLLVGGTIAGALFLPPIHPLFVLLGCFIIFNAVFLAWFVLPFYARTLPGWLRRLVARLYVVFSQYSFRRAIYVVREQVGVDPFASSYDAAAGADVVRIDGEKRHFKDVGRRMNYLSNRPVGLALERFNVVLDPIDAEIGMLRAELLENSESLRKFTSEKEDIGEAVIEHAEVGLERFGVDLEYARHLLGGAARPRDGEDTKQFIIISQFPFKSANAIDVMMWVGAFIAAFFTVYLAFGMNAGGGSGGGSSIDISIMIHGGLL